MEVKQVTLSNKLRVVNFNIYGVLVFEDGSILETVSKHWSEDTESPSVVGEKRSNCDRFVELGRDSKPLGRCLEVLKELQDLARNGEIDIILVSSSFFQKAKEYASIFKVYEPVPLKDSRNIYSVHQFYK